MTEKEIEKLTRRQLIELLLEITEENEHLKESNLKLEKELNNKKISISSSGSIAEAALKINKIFEAADAAAKLYLQNIKYKADTENKALASKKAAAPVKSGIKSKDHASSTKSSTASPLNTQSQKKATASSAKTSSNIQSSTDKKQQTTKVSATMNSANGKRPTQPSQSAPVSKASSDVKSAPSVSQNTTDVRKAPSPTDVNPKARTTASDKTTVQSVKHTENNSESADIKHNNGKD